MHTNVCRRCGKRLIFWCAYPRGDIIQYCCLGSLLCPAVPHCCLACPYALLSCLDALLVLQRSPLLLRLPADYPLPAVFNIASCFYWLALFPFFRSYCLFFLMPGYTSISCIILLNCSCSKVFAVAAIYLIIRFTSLMFHCCPIARYLLICRYRVPLCVPWLCCVV